MSPESIGIGQTSQIQNKQDSGGTEVNSILKQRSRSGAMIINNKETPQIQTDGQKAQMEVDRTLSAKLASNNIQVKIEVKNELPAILDAVEQINVKNPEVNTENKTTTPEVKVTVPNEIKPPFSSLIKNFGPIPDKTVEGDLLRIINNKNDSQLFEKFAEKELSTENTMAFNSLRQIAEKAPHLSESQLSGELSAFHTTYMAKSSEIEININSKVKNMVNDFISGKPGVDAEQTLEALRGEIVENLIDTNARFVVSKDFKDSSAGFKEIVKVDQMLLNDGLSGPQKLAALDKLSNRN